MGWAVVGNTFQGSDSNEVFRIGYYAASLYLTNFGAILVNHFNIFITVLMYKQLFYFLFIGLFFNACKKDPSGTPANPSENETEYFQAASINTLARPPIFSDIDYNRIYFSGGEFDFDLVAYDYSTRKILSRTNIGYPLYRTVIAFGESNGRRELYVARGKGINVYDAKTLEKIDSLEVFPKTDNRYIRSIGSNEKNIIFVSSTSQDNGIWSYNRATESLIELSQGRDYNSTLYAFSKSDNTTEVLSMGGSVTSVLGVSIDIFDNNGVVKSTVNNFEFRGLEPRLIWGSGDCDFIISDNTVYAKAPLGIIHLFNTYRDYWISPDCKTIYGLSINGMLDVIEYPGFKIKKSIDLPVGLANAVKEYSSTFHLFFDDGIIYIVNSLEKGTGSPSVYFTFWLTALKV